MGHKLVICPYCEEKQVGKRGTTDTGKQRYRCQNEQCSHQSFLLDPAYKGRLPVVKQQVKEPRWLWHAIDHGTGKVLAYVFGRRQDDVFLQLKALLDPFGLTHFFMDHWGRMPGTWPPKRMSLANAIRNKLSGSI